MLLLVEILFRLILLHGPDGKEIWINPDLIVSMRPKAGQGNFTDQANCLINLGDGKFVTIIEDCPTVKSLSEQEHKIPE